MADKEIELTKIAEYIYSYLNISGAGPENSLGANRAVVVGEKFAVAIDSGISAKEGKRFIQDIQKVTQKPVKFLVNTHGHPDHVFGNSEFEKIGAIIVSHERSKNMIHKLDVAAEIEKLKDVGMTEEDMEGTVLSSPTLTFDSKMGLDLGNFTIEILHFGRAHTAGDILIHIPEEKVLFTGDILETDYHPYVGDPEADIDGWIKVLERMMDLDIERFIPGHGPVSSKEDVAALIKYLKEFDFNVKKLAAKYDDVGIISEELESLLPARNEMKIVIGGGVIKYLDR